MNKAAALETRSALPHRLSVLVVLLTFPLLWVGGLVTTYDAGMSVPDWPNTYGYNLLLYPWYTWLVGPWDLFIEHGHRLLGILVGLATIALVASLWWRDRRRWVFWYGVASLLAVILQGSLGGFRVVLSDVVLAKIHGCFGPLFFVMAIGLAAVTSRWWQEAAGSVRIAAHTRVRFWTLAVPLLVYAQLVLGAQLRHFPSGLTPRMLKSLAMFHVGLGMLLGLLCCWVAWVVWRACRGQPKLVRPALALAIIVIGQVSLGIGAWVTQYGWFPPFNNLDWTAGFVVVSRSWAQSHLATAHVAGGSLLLGVSALLAMRAWRMTVAPQPVLPALPRAAGALA